MDEIKGNYSVVDEIDYKATAAVTEGEGPIESVLSTAKAFVDQQQFVFHMLWRKAIPSKQRISEIEEGIKREFIETIQDHSEIKKLISGLISSAVKEINIVFPTKNLFYEFEKENYLRLLKDKLSHDNDLSIRILSDQNPDRISNLETLSLHQNFKFGFSSKKIQFQVIIIIIDSEYVLAIESKDISNNLIDNMYDENSDTGIAIYSNNEYTVMSYDTILKHFGQKLR
jgi:hypothetical protein